jgi:hypothetical protein
MDAEGMEGMKILTREEIEQMQAGREMDALIAEMMGDEPKILFGIMNKAGTAFYDIRDSFSWAQKQIDESKSLQAAGANVREIFSFKKYSSDIAATFCAVNKLENETPTILTDIRRMSMNGEKSGLQWFAHMRKITGENIYVMMGDVSLPVAVCKAILMIKNGYHS